MANLTKNTWGVCSLYICICDKVLTNFAMIDYEMYPTKYPKNSTITLDIYTHSIIENPPTIKELRKLFKNFANVTFKLKILFKYIDANVFKSIAKLAGRLKLLTRTKSFDISKKDATVFETLLFMAVFKKDINPSFFKKYRELRICTKKPETGMPKHFIWTLNPGIFFDRISLKAGMTKVSTIVNWKDYDIPITNQFSRYLNKLEKACFLISSHMKENELQIFGCDKSVLNGFEELAKNAEISIEIKILIVNSINKNTFDNDIVSIDMNSKIFKREKTIVTFDVSRESLGTIIKKTDVVLNRNSSTFAMTNLLFFATDAVELMLKIAEVFKSKTSCKKITILSDLFYFLKKKFQTNGIREFNTNGIGKILENAIIMTADKEKCTYRRKKLDLSVITKYVRDRLKLCTSEEITKNTTEEVRDLIISMYTETEKTFFPVVDDSYLMCSCGNANLHIKRIFNYIEEEMENISKASKPMEQQILHHYRINTWSASIVKNIDNKEITIVI